MRFHGNPPILLDWGPETDVAEITLESLTKVYSDGSVQVAQYNGDGSRSYSTMRVKAPRYLRL